MRKGIVYSYDRRGPRIVSASGSRYEVGRQLGEACRDFIRVDAEKAAASLNGSTRSWLKSAFSATQHAFPGAAQEILGIAEGAGIPPLHVLAAQSEELDDFAQGCTDIVALGSATSDGHTLIGHNNDEAVEQLPTVLVRARTPGNPDVLGMSLRGTGFSIAFNSMGIAFTGNHLTQNDVKEGVPRLVLFGEMARAPSLEAAFSIANHPLRASSYNTLVTAHDRCWSLEGSAERMACIRIEPPGGVFAHANHYRVPQLRRVEDKPIKDLVDSQKRQGLAEAMLYRGYGTHTPETLRAILVDHTVPLCNHDVEEGVTTFSVVVDVTARSIQFAPGAPCSTPWQALSF